MADAYIVGSVRTPVGKREGGLSAVHPSDLGAHVALSLLQRTIAANSMIVERVANVATAA
jgi:acetyl-CoA acetyltransferase